MRRKKTVKVEADKIKNILITRTAIKELVSEDIVEKVIMFQFKDFRDMIFEHDQIEVSGFGKFLVSPNKVSKKIKYMEGTINKYQHKLDEQVNVPLKKRDYWQALVTSAKEALEDLKTRTNGYENKH